MMPGRLALLGLLAGTVPCGFAAAAGDLSARDAVVVPFFQKAHHELAQFAILLRRPVDARQDLVVALAGPRPLGKPPSGKSYWWGAGQFVGIFLEQRQRPAETLQLAMLPSGEQESGLIRILRVNKEELVLARTPEKGSGPDNIELLLDIAAKKVVREIRYAPFAARRIVMQAGTPYFVASDSHEAVIIRPGASGHGFAIVKGPEEQAVRARISFLPSISGGREYSDVAREQFHTVKFGPNGQFALTEGPGGSSTKRRFVIERKGGKTLRFPLSQSTRQQFVRARPDAIVSGLKPETAELNEDIGEFQIADNQLWFGKTFYDGEGWTGVGGFGYFDTNTRKYVLFSPPAIRRYSVSALLVERDAVWLSLVHNGEYGSSGAGVLRWDRASREVTRFPLDSCAVAITRYQGQLYLATSDGIAVLDGSRLRRYFIDAARDGRRRVEEETEP